jgi:hypothetical protein
MPLDESLDHGCDLLFVGHVAGDGIRAPAALANLGSGRVARVRVDVGQHDVRAAFRQGVSESLAEATASAGDDRHAAFVL